MKEERYYGILTSVDWNSNKWQAPSKEDLPHVNFSFVKENGITFTSLNFGQNGEPPLDSVEYYSGLLPQLCTKTLDKKKSKDILIVFIRSKNWRDGDTYIVGLYAFPMFKKGTKEIRIEETLHPFQYNVMSLPKNIHRIDNYLNIDTSRESKKFIPNNTELGRQGFNYLNQYNVAKILDVMVELNPHDEKLKNLKAKVLIEINKRK